jgi:hypothetical protein
LLPPTCAAAIQDFLGHETFDFKNGMRAGEGDLIVYDREIIKYGYIQLSDKPGLGIEINRDFATKYLMDGEICGASLTGCRFRAKSGRVHRTRAASSFAGER